MSIKNYYVYGDEKKLRTLKEEYKLLGRDCKIEDGKLTVFAYAKKVEPKTENR